MLSFNLAKFLIIELLDPFKYLAGFQRGQAVNISGSIKQPRGPGKAPSKRVQGILSSQDPEPFPKINNQCPGFGKVKDNVKFDLSLPTRYYRQRSRRES